MTQFSIHERQKHNPSEVLHTAGLQNKSYFIKLIAQWANKISYVNKCYGISVAHWQFAGFWFMGTMGQMLARKIIFPLSFLSHDIVIAIYISINSWLCKWSYHELTHVWLSIWLNCKTNRANEQQQQIFNKSDKLCKINPEGTCGPIWPVMVSLFLPFLRLYYSVDRIVDMWNI